MRKSRIPIRNIFYLLAYAWDQLQVLKEIRLDSAEYDVPSDFFARLLITLFETARKMGLAQGYVSFSEFRTSPKGKFNLTDSLKTGALQRNAISCVLDELTLNTIENQILKASFNTLIKSPELKRELREQLRYQVTKLSTVSDIAVTPRHFKTSGTPSRKSVYPLMLNICELLHYSQLPEENQTGEVRFLSFLEDERAMAKLFEAFIRNFYKSEQSEFPVVGAPAIEWDASPMDMKDLSLLPSMLTDTTLESPERVVIIETKYYLNALTSNRGGTDKIRSQHLYQLMSYVTNKATSSKKPVEGILLYPTVDSPITAEFRIQGHRMRVCTVDLSRPWQEIECFLLTLIDQKASLNLQTA